MNTEKILTLQSKVSVSKTQASSELLGEAIILELESGVYYGLNETGSLIWNLIRESKTLAEIQKIVLEEYEVDSKTCSHYIIELVRDLETKGLLIIEDETID